MLTSVVSAAEVLIRFGEGGVSDGGLLDSAARSENGRENYNYGASQAINTGWETSTDELIAFSHWTNIFGSGANLVPLGSTINKAELMMVVKGTSGTGDRTVNVYAMTTQITDMGDGDSRGAESGEVCWNWRAYDTVAWGGDGPVAGTDYTITGGASLTIPAGMTTTATWDVTDIVQAWSDGTANYGFILRGDAWNDSDTRTDFWSYEAEDSGNVPVLKIYYEQIPEPATMSLLALGGLGVLIRRKR
ncbi:MAG: DNRLRE domain-containing protein [Phycisphaerae bacterium]|nr:DNRLRE domain-containing protein [Phycisphaerae bacterium]